MESVVLFKALAYDDILRPVVVFNAVQMMNHFSWKQVASKLFLGNKAMFQNSAIRLLAVRMKLGEDNDVAIGQSGFSSFKARMFFWVNFQKFIPTLSASLRWVVLVIFKHLLFTVQTSCVFRRIPRALPCGRVEWHIFAKEASHAV